MQNPDEDRLLRDLFKDYSRDVRPVVNMSQAVQVWFGITFSQIIDVVIMMTKNGIAVSKEAVVKNFKLETVEKKGNELWGIGR